MRLLYLTPDFHHPLVRGPNRHYHFIKELAPRHSITLLAVARSEVPPQAVTDLEAWTEKLLIFPADNASRVSSLPLIGRRLGQTVGLKRAVSEMKRAYKQLVEQEDFDLVLFHGKSLFSVIADRDELPIVTDFCDATSMRIKARMAFADKAQAPLLALRYRQMRRVEQEMVHKTPYVAFISSRDRQFIMGPGDESPIVPNGLDHDYWTRRTSARNPNTLLFTGIMDYAPNEDAALYLIDEILPLLRSRLPEVEVVIAGRNPTAALKERDQLPDVTITGFVDDMRDAYEMATVFAAPVRYASGMQNKIQEALAMEVPVVTTSIVADGIRLDPEETVPLVVADEPAAFADAVVALLRNPEERARLESAGRRFAAERFDWSRSARKFEEMFAAAVNGEVEK